MAYETQTVGLCPNCGESITQEYLLIEYESDGRPARFAECPACREVVHPSGE
jgi:predicted RNA-binding Zn-ribbon protein involved in translation (DUF1610 family)